MSRIARIVWLAVLVASCGTVIAQTASASTPSTDLTVAEITVAQVEAAMAELETLELDEAALSAANAQYTTALEFLNLATEFIGRRERFERLTAEAPARLDALQAELAVPPEEVVVSPPDGATAASLEQLLAEANAELQAIRAGAEPGFGKGELSDPATLHKLGRFIGHRRDAPPDA